MANDIRRQRAHGAVRERRRVPSPRATYHPYWALAVTPPSLHEFFVASAGVAGALIGLLFVAISVEHERLTSEDADQVHRIRAAAALTSFTNAFAISLFALIPFRGLGWTALVVSLGGLFYVIGSLLSIARVRLVGPVAQRDALFLVGLVVVLVLQLYYAVRLISRSHDTGAAEDIAVLVIVCFLIGIARAWELIGGPSIGLRSEIREIVHERRHHSDADDGQIAPARDRPSGERVDGG